MGINLIPEVYFESLIIVEREFLNFHEPDTEPRQIADGSVEDGCVTPGIHKILKFDTRLKNIGDTDLNLGRRDKSDMFKESKIHSYIFKYPFFKYVLRDDKEERYVTFKHPWCLSDDPNNCDDMIIRKNKADSYQKDHQCQFIVIDGIEDGDYIFEVTVNYFSLELLNKGQIGPIIHEDNYEDNTIQIPINIIGNKITQK